MKRTKVAIIGGGLSGLSTAANLLRNVGKEYLDVTVFETKPYLGGQTASWDQGGTTVETGIHLAFPWYENLDELYRQIGEPLEPVQTDSSYHILNGKTDRIDTLYVGSAVPKIPILGDIASVLKTLYGLARFPGLNKRERKKLARLFWQVICTNDAEAEKHDSKSVKEFLTEEGCTEAMIKQMALETVTIQGLRVDEAGATSFIKFLRIMYGCIGKFDGSFFPKPIGEALIDPLENFIKERGGTIRISERVQQLIIDETSNVQAILTDKGNYYDFNNVVVALPGYLVPPLLSKQYRDMELFSKLKSLKSANVITITLWYNERVLPDGNVRISNREGVIFDAVTDKAYHWGLPPEEGSVLQVLIDAADDIDHLSDKEIYRLVFHDLNRFFPKCRASRQLLQRDLIRHHDIYCETKPGYWSRVPRSHETPIVNLLLAGDYTNGPYNYGMESAVISGMAVANLLRERQGLTTFPIISVRYPGFIEKRLAQTNS